MSTEGKLVTTPSGKLMFQSACQWQWRCKGSEGWDRCDFCLLCFRQECTNIPIFTDDGPGSMPPGDDTPGNGGGGVGTGTGPAPTNPGQQPPRDPCASATVFYRLMPSCGGGGDEFPILTPCKKLKELFNPLKAKIKPLITNGMYSYINNSSTGEGGIYVKKDAQGNVTTEIAPYTAENRFQ